MVRKLKRSKVYEFHDYDKNLSLKCGYGLWLVILYFMHPYILLVSTRSVGRGGGRKEGLEVLKNMVYPDNFSLVLAILATLPALCFIYAWTRRRPGASTMVRYIWRNGVHMLSFAALFNIVVVFVPFMMGLKLTLGMIGWAQIGLSVIVILYLQFSERVKDTFADFPEDQGGS